MYRCDVCDRLSEPGALCNRLVIETEPIEHPRRPRIYWHRHPPKRAGDKGHWVDDPGGLGTRIVREVNACAACVAKQLALDRLRGAAAA